jgi:hypothetical protein
MPRGRLSALCITLTAEEEAQCRHWARQTTISHVQSRAARVILARGQGLPIAHIAAQVGLTRLHVYRWLRRFQAQRCAGLLRKRRRV